MLLLAAVPLSAQRRGYKLGYTPKREVRKVGAKDSEQWNVTDSVKQGEVTPVMSQLHFSGYDKNQNSTTESLFVSNRCDSTITGFKIEIVYRTLDGRVLHKRSVNQRCLLPAGETRRIDFDSWDRQRSFYYKRSAPTRRGGNPYDVVIRLKALRYFGS